MTIHSERAVPPSASADQPAVRPDQQVEPIWPSRTVRVIGRLRNLLNPLVVKRAGRRGFAMAARLEHVGRRSGRTYVTPVTTRRAGDVVLIALTFGNQSDWCQNVLAARGCTIRIDGVDYAATAPALVSWQDATSLVRVAFRPAERAMLRVLGIKQFLRLDLRRLPA
jgi:deazaflavin-dependent oxidoreductase (nitroreductase family)